MKIYSKLAFGEHALVMFYTKVLTNYMQLNPGKDVYYRMCPDCGFIKIDNVVDMKEGEEPKIFIDGPTNLTPCLQCAAFANKYPEIFSYMRKMFAIRGALAEYGVKKTYIEYILTPPSEQPPETPH